MRFQRLLFCHAGGKFYRRDNRQQVVAQIRKTHADQPSDDGTGRAYDRLDYIGTRKIRPGILGNQLSRAGDLEHVVESALEQSGHDEVDIVEVVELTVKRGCRQRDLPLVIAKLFKFVVGRGLGLVRTVPNTFAAVDTAVAVDLRMSVVDTDRFGRATLDAVGAALAFI